MDSVKCTKDSAKCTKDSAKCTVDSAKCTKESAKCTKDSAKCTVGSAKCTVDSAKCTKDSAKSTKESVKTSSLENMLDRDVQIVTDKLKAGASSAREVLEKVNGVSCDPYTKAIKVDNINKVKILVDGMEKDLEYIKNLAPDRLKKIEVIRDPGGRYGLEGYSAVINIILTKDYVGSEIYLGDDYMLDYKAIKPEYRTVQNNVNATLNYVNNNINLYGSYNNSYNNFNFNTSMKKQYSDGLVIEDNTINNDVNNHIKESSNNYTLSVDYYLNPKNTISFESDISVQPASNNTTNLLFNVRNYFQGIIFDQSNYQATGTSKELNATNTLYYIFKPNKNNVFNANFSYSYSNHNYTSNFIDPLFFINNQDGNDKKNSTKFYLEYTHTFSSKSNLELGYGNTLIQENNNFVSLHLPYSFSYSDIRQKLYGYYSLQATKKFSLKLGAAGETSTPDADGIKKHYYLLEPYADLKYNLSQLLNFKLKYRAEGTYPTLDETNPFTFFIDKESVKIGNPLLQPELVHKIFLQANFLSGLLTFEPYHHFSGNMITETGYLRSDNIYVSDYNNISKYTRNGLITRLTIPLAKTLFWESNADIFNNMMKYYGVTNDFNFWTMSSQLIYQNEKYGTTIGLKYQKNLVKDITLQGYQNENNDLWISFIQQPFFKERLNIMFLYFIPTDFGVKYDQGGFKQTAFYQEIKNVDISLIKHLFMLQVNYRLSKGKSAKNTEKKIEKDNKKNKKGFF